MKRLFILLTLLIITTALSAQNIKFRLRQSTITSNTGGNVINRGDEFDLIVDANGNGNTTTRQLLFDLQYDYANFDLVSVNHTGTGGNGGVLPAGSVISLTSQAYPFYSYNATTNNTTSNGTTNYQNANYTYVQNSANAILRATLTWTTNNGMPYNGYDRLLVIRFRLKAASTAYSFNPIKLNFVAGWDVNGTYNSTTQEAPLSAAVQMNQNFGKYVSAKVDLNSNLYNIAGMKVSFRDTVTNQGVLFDVLTDGTVNINQAQLAANKVYDVSVMTRMDTLYAMYNNAITISDFTAAQSEFTQTSLEGALTHNVIKTGQSAFTADINKDKVFNGSDLPMLLAQVAGIDTLVMLPAGYTVGSNGYMSLPTWHATEARSVPGAVEWGYFVINGYGTGVSRFHIDKRQFVQGGPTADQIKSLQIFDLYAGPVVYDNALSDATWAVYKVPTSFSNISSSIYTAFIRSTGQNDYAVKAEFNFNVSPNSSWGAISTANWNTITSPRAIFKTGSLGSNAQLNLKYILWGDVNRSHSSQVVTFDGAASNTVVQTNAVNSLSTNTAFITMANTTTASTETTAELDNIDVNLSNLTVTSNSIEVPVAINTKDAYVSGLQFEFKYDPAKIKFEELLVNLPNTWYTFVNSTEGRVKFGSLDKNNTTSITGAVVPFKLKFSSLVNGLDLLTVIRVSPVMDAADKNGVQLKINLSSDKIKLTGYNNF